MKNLLLLVQYKECVCETCSFSWPLSTLVDIDVTHMINPPSPSSFILAYCKLDGGEGLGTRVCLPNINSLSLPLCFGGAWVCVFVILMLGSCFVMRTMLRT